MTAIPCRSLPDPCLSFTKTFETDLRPHGARQSAGAGGGHGAADQGGEGVVASLHLTHGLVLGRHVAAVHGVVRGALAGCVGRGLAAHL